MNVWQRYEGKKVFILTIKSRTYSGIVEEIVDTGDGITWITIINSKDGKFATFLASEISEIKEEL